MKFKKNKPSNGKKLILYLILGGFLLKLIKLFCLKKEARRLKNNFEKYIKKEKEEVGELCRGRENFKKYPRQSDQLRTMETAAQVS